MKRDQRGVRPSLQGYGNSGLSMGFPGKSYSLSGAFTDLGKVAAAAARVLE